MMPQSTSAAPTDSTVRDHRSFSIALVEILIASAPVALLLYAWSAIATDGKWEHQLRYLARMGTGAIADAGMVLPTLFTIVIGFYAIIVGQSIAGRTKAIVARTKNSLGGAAQIVAAAATVYVALTLFAAIVDPSLYPRLVGMVVMWLVIVVLGAGTGAFAFGSLPEQKDSAEHRKVSAERLLSQLRSSLPKWRFAIANLVGAFIAMLVPAFLIGRLAILGAPFSDWTGPAAVAGVFGLLTLVFVGLVTGLSLIEETSKRTAIAYRTIILIVAVAFALLAFSYDGELPDSGVMAGVLTLVFVLSAVSSLWIPLATWGPSWKWLPGFAIASLAALWLRGQARRSGERAEKINDVITAEANAPLEAFGQ